MFFLTARTLASQVFSTPVVLRTRVDNYVGQSCNAMGVGIDCEENDRLPGPVAARVGSLAIATLDAVVCFLGHVARRFPFA